MLSSSLPYNHIITAFYNAKSNMINDKDWENIQIIHNFLEPFYNATKQLSGQYYSISNLVLIYLFNITNIFQ